MRLVTCFLRACGTISREEVVWVDSQEIAEKGDVSELLNARMAAAEHGCLAVKAARSEPLWWAKWFRTSTPWWTPGRR